MNATAHRDYIRRRNYALRLEMRQTKQELIKRAKGFRIKVTKDMTKEQLAKRIIGWKA